MPADAAEIGPWVPIDGRSEEGVAVWLAGLEMWHIVIVAHGIFLLMPAVDTDKQLLDQIGVTDCRLTHLLEP
jgi:hypothetical protein